MGSALIPHAVTPAVSLPFLLEVPILRSWFDAQHPPSLEAFGVLVAVGTLAGVTVTLRHARDRGLNAQRMNGFLGAIVVGAFFGGHLLSALFYQWQGTHTAPLHVVRWWDCLSSVGGVAGAMLGALAWRRSTGASLLSYADVVSSAFPLVWAFVRAGCALIHDHPGRRWDGWLAVAYPTAQGWERRLDLGLYELILTVPVALLFLLLWRGEPRRVGFYTGTLFVIYAPVRFCLDFLRIDGGSSWSGDPRYLWLTPAQWLCLALLPWGLYVLQIAPPRNRLILNGERWESA